MLLRPWLSCLPCFRGGHGLAEPPTAGALRATSSRQAVVRSQPATDDTNVIWAAGTLCGSSLIWSATKLHTKAPALRPSVPLDTQGQHRQRLLACEARRVG